MMNSENNDLKHSFEKDVDNNLELSLQELKPLLTWEQFNQMYYVEASGNMSTEISMCDFTPMYTKGTAYIKSLTNVRLYLRKDMSFVKEYTIESLPSHLINKEVKEMIQKEFNIMESISSISPKMNVNGNHEDEKFFRDFTAEEQNDYNKSLDKLFVPIGLNILNDF